MMRRYAYASILELWYVREHISSTPLAPFNAPNTSQARCTLDIRCGIDEAGLKPTQEPTFRPASAFLSAVDSRAMCLRNQFGDSPRFRPPSLRARTSFSSSLVRLLKSVFMNLSPPNPLALYMVWQWRRVRAKTFAQWEEGGGGEGIGAESEEVGGGGKPDGLPFLSLPQSSQGEYSDHQCISRSHAVQVQEGRVTLALPKYHTRSFDIVLEPFLDCTGFTGISELPLQWLKFCAELIPYDSACASGPPHPRFQYNAEIHAKIVPLCCGNIVCSVIKAHSSVTELLAQVPVSAIEKLEHPSRLEHEVGEQFSDISMRLQQMCFPITLHVGETHVRITSVRTQPISSGLSCKSTEIMPTDAIRSVKDDAPASEVLQFLADLETVEMQKLFGLDSLTQSSEYISHDESGDKAKVDAQENLTALLVRILEVTARSRGLLNDWRARWMGLATSSAFQYLPSVQM
ncbi:hypothetical protein R3P38DRAFT_2797043 [Favolaschia claudopus]|uniref:FHA domain-containing protein n=1 Tax=Favolaschia claudopus TaxID=2862362 RepID=A0AAW0A5A9_9AGAR